MKARNGKLLCSTAIGMALAGGAQAADIVFDDAGNVAPVPQAVESGLPAVSGINGKLTIQKESLDHSLFPDHIRSIAAIGSLSFPVNYRYGLQIDAGLGTFDTGSGERTVGGVGAHLFWRDPNSALLGVYAHYVSTNSGAGEFHDVRIGVEGELYFGQYSLEAFAGVDLIDNLAGDSSEFYGELIGAWYMTENFRLEGGVVHRFGDTFGRVGTEYMLPIFNNNIALYAQGDFGSDTAIRGGVRFYFGEAGKSLIDRHRQDDPKQYIPDFFGAPIAGGAVFCPPPPDGAAAVLIDSCPEVE